MGERFAASDCLSIVSTDDEVRTASVSFWGATTASVVINRKKVEKIFASNAFRG